MNLTNNNFGLSGQSDYDYFIFCNKKCKKRRAEKRKVRLEKKRLKNDERRAETERVRAETVLMQQGFEPEGSVEPAPSPSSPAPPPAPPRPSFPSGGIKRPPPKPYYKPAPIVAQQAPNRPTKSGLGNTPLLLIGLVVVGGIVVILSRRKNSMQSAIMAAK